MLQYVLSALAGIMIGVAAMRIWRERPGTPGEERPVATPTIPDEASRPLSYAARVLRPSGRSVLLAAAGLAAVAGGVLALRSPDSPEAPVGPETDASVAQSSAAGTGVAAPAGKSLADVDTMISRLADRLKSNPRDGEGFRMLGWSYVMTGRAGQAITPYRQALSLSPGDAPVHEGYGEALVGVAQGSVTEEARAEFARAVAINPAEPRARYFLALWQAQHGQQRQALDKWIALSNEGPADAPWQSDVHRQIDATAGKLGVDVSARLKPPTIPVPAGTMPGAVPAAIAGGAPPPLDANVLAAGERMPEASRQAMVGQMVERLASRLKTHPVDPGGWIALLRSRMVMQQAGQARGDLAAARRALAHSPANLAQVETAASGLGVPGAR